MVEGWRGWLGTINGVVLLTVAALPLAALAAWALARRRRATGMTAAWRRSLAEVGIVYGTVPWVWMIMLPGSRAGVVSGRVSLVPLRDLLTVLAAEPLTLVRQVVGNLLVFATLGFFAPVRFAALVSVPRILALAAGRSVLVETAQYVLHLDRVSSVDDVLLNTTAVVQGDGVPPTSVSHTGLAPTTKWPRPGSVLPIIVDRADPAVFRIEWKKVPTAQVAAAAEADRLAAAMRTGAPVPGSDHSESAALDRGGPMAYTSVLGQAPAWRTDLLDHTQQVADRPVLACVQVKALDGDEPITADQFEADLVKALSGPYAGVILFD